MDRADEGRHPPGAGAGAGWEEAWAFDWAAADASVGGSVRLALRPGEGVARYWACVAGAGRPLVTVVDHEVRPPAGRSLEVRAEGLWADHVCETPFDHWTLGAEAFAVALDDPLDAWGRAWGDRVPFGVDLEWETEGEVRPVADGYALACRVTGEVIVGDERLAVDAGGWRSHTWGGDRWSLAWSSLAGRLDDGTSLWATAPAVEGAGGPATVVVDGLPVAVGPVSEGAGGPAMVVVDGLPVAVGPVFEGAGGPATVVVDGLPVAVEPVALAPVLVPVAGGGPSRLGRALCRLDAAGRRGAGWVEWNRPA